MCFAPKVPKPPPPVQPPTRATAEDQADLLRKRKSTQDGYATAIGTSLSGSKDFGSGAQQPYLSGGKAPTLGVSP